MLYASSLGLEVIMPAYPLDGSRMPTLVGRGRGLGSYNEGTCAQGADFACSVVNGTDSCRPCNTTQLGAFKMLQTQLNRLVVATGLSTKYRLKVDGRIGPLTATTLAAVDRAIPNLYSGAPNAIQLVIKAVRANAKIEDTYRAMAIYVPELNSYLAPIADRLGAPQDVPPPPSAPSDGGNGPIPVPGSGEPPIVVGVIRKPGLAPMLAMVGGVVGLGLAAYGIKRYRERHA